jgi:dipeptidase E
MSAMRILALGGHDFSSRPEDRAIRDFMLGLLDEPQPRVCLLPTASGDPSEQISRFYNSFGEADCELSDLSLFRLEMKPVALRDHLLAQDLIYVGGGSLVNLLAIWAAHEIAEILQTAWASGVVLAGQSAGAMCWLEAGITKSSGSPMAAAGLGLLPGSLCVHYHQEPERRLAYLAAVEQAMPGGHGLDDYAGLLWEGARLALALSARPGAGVYRVTAVAEGVIETRIATTPIEPIESDAPAEDIAEFRRVSRARMGARFG